MLKIKDIIREIELYAPLPLQESFDNAGVQVGDVNQEATGALLCLDVTEEVIDEAIEENCNLIIAHHPLAFRSFKSLTGRNYIERCMMKACKYDLVVYAAHTNLDNAVGGVNYRLAELIGLQNVRILSPQKEALLKLVTFVPESHADLVRTTLFNAGAGKVGNYDSSSFNLHGTGTFRAGEGCHPFCGEVGELHTESEVRIETILPAYRKGTVLRALLSVHPYEEPAFDFYRLENSWEQAGSGVVGELPEEEEELAFLQRIKDLFHVGCVKYSALTGNPIREVAICGGSAIAAVAPVVKANDSEMSMSLGTIFILNAIALFIFPPIGHLLGMTQEQFGMWAAIAIHDTSSVVGAGAAYGATALEVATMVKLTRALWIIPVTVLTMFLFRQKGAKVSIPWFILFFVLAMVANTFLPIPEVASSSLVWLAKKGLTLTLFLIGAGLSREVFRQVGVRPMVQGVVLWFFIGLMSLGVILLF